MHISPLAPLIIVWNWCLWRQTPYIVKSAHIYFLWKWHELSEIPQTAKCFDLHFCTQMRCHIVPNASDIFPCADVGNGLLTNRGRVTHPCVTKRGHHSFTLWLVAFSVPSHNPNQWRFIVNWTIGSKSQSNFNPKVMISIRENATEIWFAKSKPFRLPRPQCVKCEWHVMNNKLP